MRLGVACKFKHAWRQFLQNTFARNGFIARMQGRKLDRDARPVRQRGISGGLADCRDGARVAVEIALCVRVRARPLAQHIVGVAELALLAGTLERVLDALPEYEMRTEQAHRLS